jgi:hypothetical protein
MTPLGRFLSLFVTGQLDTITDETEQDTMLYDVELGIQELIRWSNGDTKDEKLKSHWVLQAAVLRKNQLKAKSIWKRI